MKQTGNKKKTTLLMRILGLAVVFVFLGSIAVNQHNLVMESKKVSSIAEIAVPEVPNVTTERAFGVVSAAEWATYYPEIYTTWLANSENTGTNGSRAKYTEDTPDIQILYQGMAFSFDYTEAVGHNYTLDDIEETTRPHKLANCLTCKTPDMTAMVNALGKDVYAKDFEEVFPLMEESVSCYSCHANTPGTIVITHDYAAEAWNDEIEAGMINAGSVSCGQCHIEYYFDKETKATSVPYDSMDNFDPDSILAYYNEIGFVDYTNENTGVGMIKVQHPEFETYYGAGSIHAGTYTCADCHMGVAYNEKGDPYANHTLASPLVNEELISTTCSTCHSDLAGMVRGIQQRTVARENEVSAKLVQINTLLAEAIEKGSLSENVINEIKSLDRDAQFYWDFCYVENAEGAHNSTMANELLDKAEALADQALALLK